jgi:hypothetical protein
MTKYPFAGIGCLILAAVFFYLIVDGDHPLYCMSLPALFFIVGAYHIIPGKREPYEKPEESFESEFLSFKEFVGEEAFQGRTGGYFNSKGIMASQASRNIIPVGIIPEENKQKGFFIVQEKANRLMETFRSLGHLTSYESRDPNFVFPENTQARGQWGGAVIIDKYFTIYAFSGFPELLDEAFVCWVAWNREKMTFDDFKVICERRSDNPYLQKILEYILKK